MRATQNSGCGTTCVPALADGLARHIIGKVELSVCLVVCHAPPPLLITPACHVRRFVCGHTRASARPATATAHALQVCRALFDGGADMLRRNGKNRTPRSQLKLPDAVKVRQKAVRNP